MSDSDVSWYRRHPILALLGFNLLVFFGVTVLAELVLRIYLPYNPGYYVSVRGSSTEVVYPYGTIKINRQGFPDEEFELDGRPRVGYFGDSVTYGVGAGYGHRFSELLEEAYPEYEHMNFSGIGLSISSSTIASNTRLAGEFDLDVVLYFFNLNDIVPDSVASGEVGTPITTAKYSIIEALDWLRGKSYLYTSLRTAAKNFFEAQGIGFHGYVAYELHPKREQAIIRETAGRINEFHRALAEKGARLVLVILPYEMQISKEAEETYASHGISWEEGFLEGTPQRILEESLDEEIPVIDLIPAFVDVDDIESSRERNEVGEFFVYDRGDKLDWNHPNRAGHRAIADYLARIGLLARPPESAAAGRN